jgi:pimeloyl-ACP methyl ester carboxylesterase
MNLGRGRGVAEPTPGSLWYSITARKFSEGVLGSVRSYLECMKSILLLPLLISPNPSDPSATVSLVLDEFHRAAGMADSDQYFGMMAEDGVFIGTDADERWSVAEFRDYAEPYFSRGTGWTYVASDRNIKLSGSEDVAWFDERLQNVKYGEVRGSGVLERIDGDWKIAQYNLSFPVPNAHAPGMVKSTRRAQSLGDPRATQLFAVDGERSLSIWNKVVPAQLERPASERPVVLLLPSATFNARGTWDFPLRKYSVMNALASRGFDVFAVDVGGYGLSSPPSDNPKGGARSAVRDVLIAMDFITELRGVQKAVVVGPSWGAQVAGLFATQHPDKVRGVVLYGYRWRSRASEEVMREVMGREALEANTRPVTREAAVMDFIPGYSEEDAPAAFATHLLAQGRSVPTGALHDFMDELPLFDPAELDVPTLMLYGRMEFESMSSEGEGELTFDGEHWNEQREFFLGLPQSRHWIEVPEAGHSAHLASNHGLFLLCLAGWIERLP